MATPLLLVVHGRAGGAVPAELQALAGELADRRRAPVVLQALTAARPPAVAAAPVLTLVPLLLLPGAHVRQDVPAIARHWQAQLPGRVRRVPFVGAWPAWQRALRAELTQLKAQAGRGCEEPLLLHHPLEGPLGARYLRHLAWSSGGRCRATPYSAEQLAELQLTLTAPALPLALAANRLTDSLGARVGLPLLQRPRCRRVLLEQLEALP